MTPERGAIPITLDRERTLFYDHAATFLLVQKYGFAFANALYEVLPDPAPNALVNLRLTNEEALPYFLWAGLQRESRERGETPLTLEQCQHFIRPFSIFDIFGAVFRALVGGTVTPEPAPAPGKDAAAPVDSAPAAQPTKGKSRTTLTSRKGLPMHR